MLQRLAIEDLKENLELFPATAILGPRQVGKTTLAHQLAGQLTKPSQYFDLENPQHYQIIKENGYSYLDNFRNECIIIDEAQAIPELFTWLRPLIDSNRVPGRFLLLGSVNPALVKGISETLAGRIGYFQLGQLNYNEINSAGISINDHWYRGGFPEALLARSDKSYQLWAKNFIESYIQRDLNHLFGIDLTPTLIAKLWSMLAHLNGAIENLEVLARSMGITSPTARRYLEYIEGAYLLHRLPAWFINAKKRLVKSPKLYLRGTGLLHSLLGISSWNALQGHPAVGTSWEAYIIEQIYQLKPSQLEMHYYRTQNGAECDIVLTNGITPKACIEIKYSNTPSVSKGFYSCIEDLETKQNFVITPGSTKWPLKDNITVCSLGEFLKNDLPGII